MAHHDLGAHDEQGRRSCLAVIWAELASHRDHGGGAVAAIGLTKFSIEPVAFGITVAIASFLALVAYRHRHTKSDSADPKLVFMLGAVAQVIWLRRLSDR